MQLTPSLCALAAVFTLTLNVPAASVGPAGYFRDFSTAPAVTDFATGTIAGGANGAADATTAARLDTNVATVVAGNINGTLAISNAHPPAASASAVYSTSGYLQTRPANVRISLLMATLVNSTGSNVSRVTVAYDLAASGGGTEEIPGHRAYYSPSGAPGSWMNIAALSSAPPGALSAHIDINWANGSLLYLLWADDNGTASPDVAYQIDNFSVTTSDPPVPLSVSLTAPGDGALFLAPNVASVTLSAMTGGTVPPSSVSFFTNSVLAATVAAPGPFNVIVGLPPGMHTVHAMAANGVDPIATSASRTLRVREEFANYNGGTYVETFNSLGDAGTETPIGWYVGATLPASTVLVTVGDGSVAPAATVLGWNYGNGVDLTDRALGTAATSADRNTVLRLRNNTSSNLLAFEMRYDGEVWRHHTTLMESLTNFVSYNLGGSWTRTGFDFVSPVPPLMPATALDGHAPINRIADLGGVLTAPAPIPPGGVIYLRWFNLNDADTDGALAVDNVRFRGTMFTAISGAIGLSITYDGTHPIVTWNDPTNGYKLQHSADLGSAASWADVPGDPASPYSPPTGSGGARFYQLRRRP